jgi:hypothetical protein
VIDAEEARKVADDTIKFHSTIGFLCPDPPAKKDLQTRMTPTQTPGETAPPELKKTLTLPRTDFPMKANLPQNEPIRLNQWAQDDLYGQIRAARRGAKRYILHDGPPYANGPIHLGHALNKCLKDFVVKSKTMAGFDSPYVPGWDCHGLPIEIKVDEQLGRKKMEMPAERNLSSCKRASLSGWASSAAGTSRTSPCRPATRPRRWRRFIAFMSAGSSTRA